MTQTSRSLRTLLIITLILSATAFNAHAQKAGTVGAVNTAAKGGSGTLSLGASVFQNERISTDPTGTVHLMFLDRSTVNVGRNSSIVIDRFVYDPNRGTGEMAVSLAKGAARLVGGQVSHSDQATVKTPVATVGVRGGTATIGHAANGTFVMVHFGTATVSNGFGSQTVRAGMQVFVGADGAPNQIQPIDQSLLSDVSRSLESQGGQTAGVATPPADQDVAANSIGLGRPNVATPNFDLPNAGDQSIRGYANTVRDIVDYLQAQ
jgi:hypothetical protein